MTDRFDHAMQERLKHVSAEGMLNSLRLIGDAEAPNLIVRVTSRRENSIL